MTSVENDGAGSLTQVCERERRERLRFLVSIAVAAALGLLLWSISPKHLSGQINIVGYPTFQNFAFEQSFLAYRLVVWELPIASALVYAFLRWRGPLRDVMAPYGGRINLVDAAVTGQVPGEPPFSPARRLIQLASPVILVAVAVSSGRAAAGVRVDSVGVLAGVGYLAGVLTVTGLVRRIGPRLGLSGRLTSNGEAFSLVSCFAVALVSVMSLVLVSRRTLVITRGDERQYWPWFPVWLASVVLLVVMVWVVWRLASGWPPSRVEQRIRVALLGSVAIFLLTAAAPGSIPSFEGFDDAQSVLGADLLTRGYFPWRDFLFIHGLFEDALSSSIGFAVFQHSIWGALAGVALIVVPFLWVAHYLLSTWAGRSGSLTVVAIFLVAAWGGFPSVPRFVAVSFIFLLLGEALRRAGPWWTVLFTVAIFVEAVLVPETSFQVVAAVITIVAFEVIHRKPEGSWWSAFRRTRYFVLTGAGLSVFLAVILALNHALVPFLDYYRIFGPGHAATGAIPPTLVTARAAAMFFVSGALVVVTVWMGAWRVFGRHPWATRDWITVSAAIMTGLYAEKALGRFDLQHVNQTLAVALPLWILWGARCLDSADDFLDAQLRHVSALRPARWLLRQPMTVGALVLTLLLVPVVGWAIWQVPGHTTRVEERALTPLVGYEEPRAIDPLLLADLRTVINTYAGRNGAIFDNTNSPGYFHYLLQRAPASTFVHVSMAQTEMAQKQVREQLAASRPALVAFDSGAIGLPAWDGPRNNVRHYLVGQYLLDGWTPVLRTHSVLFMVRNDLVAKMPQVPTLTSPPQTADLDFSGATCDWGYAANFVDSTAAPPALSLPVTALGSRSRLTVSGWLYDTKRHAAPSRVVITVAKSVVADVPITISRPDVTKDLKDPAAKLSGFHVSVTLTRQGPVRVYALGADGTLHPIGTRHEPPTGDVQMPNGKRLKVTAHAHGLVDEAQWDQARLLSIPIPASANLASFQLATFTAPATIGNARLALTDKPALDLDRVGNFAPTAIRGSHEITATVLPMSGSSLTVRVGSCLQWHGYRTRTLYLLQTRGVPITGLRLSGVRD